MSKHVGEKCEKRADGDLDGHHHTIIRPVWRQAYKKSRGWLWNTTVSPRGNKVEKAIFSFKIKVKSQGHWPWCHLKGQNWWSMHAKYEVSISYGSNVIAKVKVDNRQTSRQTKRQTDKQTDRTKTICPDHSIRRHKQYAPIIRSGGIKIKLIE